MGAKRSPPLFSPQGIELVIKEFPDDLAELGKGKSGPCPSPGQVFSSSPAHQTLGSREVVCSLCDLGHLSSSWLGGGLSLKHRTEAEGAKAKGVSKCEAARTTGPRDTGGAAPRGPD